MPKFKVAAVQTYSVLERPDINLATGLRNVREAATNGAKLVVFPECMNAGYVWRDQEHAVSCSDPIPGKFTQAIGNLCKELSVYVAIGLSEKDGNKDFNSAALIGP